jgi:hypothetical protein
VWLQRDIEKIQPSKLRLQHACSIRRISPNLVLLSSAVAYKSASASLSSCLCWPWPAHFYGRTSGSISPQCPQILNYRLYTSRC